MQDCDALCAPTTVSAQLPFAAFPQWVVAFFCLSLANEAVAMQYLGDGFCDSAESQHDFNCTSLLFDDGDCLFNCPPGYVSGCASTGECTPAIYHGDGVCTPGFDCEEKQWDRGDCVHGCMNVHAENYNAHANVDDGSCCVHNDGLDDCSRPTSCELLFNQSCPCDTIEVENTIEHAGYLYSTLDDVDLEGRPSRCPTSDPDCVNNCGSSPGQNFDLQLPCGWDVFSLVHPCHVDLWASLVPLDWGSFCILDVISGAPLLSTGERAGPDGTEVTWAPEHGQIEQIQQECGALAPLRYAGSNEWLSSHSAFSPHNGFRASCSMRVLIRKPIGCHFEHIGCDGVANSGLANDRCGLCGGDSTTCEDVCGIPNGNNMSCAGCDGIAHSGALLDLCEVCGGANDCQGCDGIVHSGVVIDRCGVCGGNGTYCEGCADHADCDGLIAAGHSCSLALAGGTLATFCPEMCELNVCGCDGGRYDLGGARLDFCGVCAGNNSTCIGCDGEHHSDPTEVVTFDLCNVCGGDGSSCHGCDEVSNSGLRFDVCGVCDGHG